MKVAAQRQIQEYAVSGEFEQQTGTDRDALAQSLVDMVLSSCVAPGHDTGPVLDLLGELQPANALEGMLVAQIASAHFMAMAQLGSATRAPNSTTQAMHLQLGAKLQRLFLSQIDTLMKLRGQQQQKVRVEHVHVHGGGQAIVGAINTGRGR